MANQFSRAGASIKNDHLTGLNHCRSRFADRDLRGRTNLLAPSKIHHCRRCRQSATMHPLQEALLRHFTKIAAYGVFGETKFMTYALGNDLALALELL